MTQPHARTIASRRREARRAAYCGRLLTVAEILERLADEKGRPLPRRTWQEWRACGKTPRCYKLPNGQLRCREDEFEAWLESLREEEGANA